MQYICPFFLGIRGEKDILYVNFFYSLGLHRTPPQLRLTLGFLPAIIISPLNSSFGTIDSFHEINRIVGRS